MTALYTTIYPGVEPFLEAWAASVRAQTTQAFDVWVGLDGLESESIRHIVGDGLVHTWVVAKAGDQPTQVRLRALAHLLERYEQIVFVDSDDVLHPSRVAAAQESLREADGVACALRLVDSAGCPLVAVLTLADDEDVDDVLPRTNVFGLSNTAYRTEAVRRCLPVPPETVAFDWLLVTRAWLSGARLAFDRTTRMDYRQHTTNIACVLPPFTPAQVVRYTALVRAHYEAVLGAPAAAAYNPSRLARVREAAREADAFYESVVADPGMLVAYTQAFNAAHPPPRWWQVVAYPPLAEAWGYHRVHL